MNALQSAKDSFYIALRDRLRTLNAERVLAIDGQNVPALLVTENESATSVQPFCDCFYLMYGRVHPLNASSIALAPWALDCTLSYRTRGTCDGATDRGRVMSALDRDLLAILGPPRTAQCDYTQTPPADLGTPVFWSLPDLGAVESDGAELRRKVQLAIYFYAQENA